MTPPPGADEIRRKYDRFARWYDLAEGLPELLGFRRLRRQLLARAAGRVLEVAAGTGKTFQHYPRPCRLTAVDLSPAMLANARRRADRLGRAVALAVADGERLPFADRSFDTVVDCLALCTYPDPVAALREMARACRPGGRLLFLEHGRSDRAWIGRWQDRRADRNARALACRWNREPLDLVRGAGLGIVRSRRLLFGAVHVIEATPAGSP